MWPSPSNPRREGIRKKSPTLRAHVAKALTHEGVPASLAIAAVFFLVTAALMLMRGEILPYHPGQHVAQDIVSRVDFSYMDKDRLARTKQEARERVTHVYKPVEKVWEQLESSLLDLPDRLAMRTVDETPRSLRDQFRIDTPVLKTQLDDAALATFAEARTEQRRAAYADAVHRFVDSLRPLILLPVERRHDEIRRQEELFRSAPRIDVTGVGPVEVSRTLAAAPTEYAVAQLRTRAVQAFPDAIKDQVAAFAANNLHPTHDLDEAATAERQNRAAAEVPASAGLVPYKANQVLKHHEKPLNEADWLLLKAEQEAFVNSLPPAAYFRSKLGSVGIVFVLTILTCGYVGRYQPRIIKKHARAAAIAGLLVAGLLAAQLAALADLPIYLFCIAPTMFVAMILSVAYDRRFAMGVSAVHAILVTFALDQDLGFFLVLFVGTLACCFLLKDVRTRSTLVEIGIAAGLAMMLTAGFAGFTSLDPIQPAPYIWRSCVYVLTAAVATGFVVQGLLRPIEYLFRITTGMTLLERADAAQPLLRRLQLEAPGTWVHSLQVAALAEAGAEAIGANALLCRVGAYYHDIGKVNKPEYFVENQFDGVNRHLNLNPSVSLLVIIGHVKDGVALAKDAHLPPSLLSFIQQHHGTTLVEYFYNRACERTGRPGTGDPAVVSETQYRYPGPKPRSKEVAIVMLADCVESASRCMKDLTPARVESLVTSLATKRLMDGQFDECDLTIRELDAISRAMTKSLLSIYHGRIPYPTSANTAETPTPSTAKSA